MKNGFKSRDKIPPNPSFRARAPTRAAHSLSPPEFSAQTSVSKAVSDDIDTSLTTTQPVALQHPKWLTLLPVDVEVSVPAVTAVVTAVVVAVAVAAVVESRRRRSGSPSPSSVVS